MYHLDKTKSLLGIGDRFRPRSAGSRIPACCIRRLTPADFDACRNIYRQNEKGQVPAGFRDEFEQELHDAACLWLGVERRGELIGIGGIRFVEGRLDAAVLVFGLVRPDAHGMGYGSALLLARVAALPRPVRDFRLVMTSAAATDGFYRRHGFVFIKRATDERGHEWNLFYARLSPRAWRLSRSILAANDVAFDPDAFPLPQHAQSEGSLPGG